MASTTRCCVAGRTPPRAFSTRETVATPTPARAATSVIVAGLSPGPGVTPGSGSIANKRAGPSSGCQEESDLVLSGTNGVETGRTDRLLMLETGSNRREGYRYEEAPCGGRPRLGGTGRGARRYSSGGPQEPEGHAGHGGRLVIGWR